MDEKIAENPLHKRQNGFRTDRNTDTALSKVTNNIEKLAGAPGFAWVKINIITMFH